jgi:hypothetical protein
LRIRGSGAVSERQEPPAGQKAPGHLVAGFGQSWRLSVEKRLEDPISPEQFFTAADRGYVRIFLLYRPHLQPVKPALAK